MTEMKLCNYGILRSEGKSPETVQNILRLTKKELDFCESTYIMEITAYETLNLNELELVI
jgi:hypothetical protein